jgi:hypothetical protein
VVEAFNRRIKLTYLTELEKEKITRSPFYPRETRGYPYATPLSHGERRNLGLG